MTRFLKAAAVSVLLMASGSVLAQQTEIPADLLTLDFQRCMKDCEPGFGKETCTPLCNCTVDEFKKRLDFSKYLDLSAELSRGELSAGNRTVLDNIANFCASELEKSGVKVGSGDATQSN